MEEERKHKYEFRDSVSGTIKKVYKYGSRVYGTSSEDSDFDFIFIVESDEDVYYRVDKKNTNITVYSESVFIDKIQSHEISVLECIFQDEGDPYLKYFKLDKPRLRKSISAIASNSYGKFKKKMKQGDYETGKKSLFHSLRILGFGIQIAISERIVSYSAYNDYHTIIMKMTSKKT